MPMTEYSSADGHAVAETTLPPTTSAPALDALAFGPSFALLPVDQIAPSPTNPRKYFDQTKLAELAASIAASGVHQPILVRPLPAGRLAETFNESRAKGRKALPTHELIAGERRLRACKLAGVLTIPAMIKPLTDNQVLEVQIVENLQRDDLSELEEAEGYQALIAATGIQKEAIGDKIGRSRTYVYGRLKLLELTPPAREALREGKIDASRALLIARIPNDKLQIKALKEFTAEDYNGDARMSYRAAKAWIEQNVMLRLERATFSIVDATLVPEAGSCAECPKRTGNDRDLFADVDAPDLCTDTACFHGKEQAHNEQLVTKARASGMEVIEGEEALAIMPNKFSQRMDDWVDIDATNYRLPDIDGEASTLRQHLTEDEINGMVRMLINPHTQQTMAIVPRDLYEMVLERIEQRDDADADSLGEDFKARLEARQQERERMDAESAAFEAAAQLERRWREPAAEALVQAVRDGRVTSFEPPLLRAMLLLIADSEWLDSDVVRAVLPLDPEDEYPYREDIKAAIATIPDAELGPRMIEMLARNEADDIADRSNHGAPAISPTPVLDSLAATCQIDLQLFKRDAEAAVRAEQEPLPVDDQDGDDDTDQPEPGTLQIGARVRFLQDLKGHGGKVRKVSGREGTIEKKIGDRAWSVRFGKKAHETAVADGSELELVAAEGGEG